MAELTKTNPDIAFRAQAADNMIDAANMTAHQLLDRFIELSGEIEDGTTTSDGERDYGRVEVSPDAHVAHRNRDIVAGAMRARFGVRLSFENEYGDMPF